jgi:hypothetical protein
MDDDEKPVLHLARKQEPTATLWPSEQWLLHNPQLGAAPEAQFW